MDSDHILDESAPPISELPVRRVLPFELWVSAGRLERSGALPGGDRSRNGNGQLPRRRQLPEILSMGERRLWAAVRLASESLLSLQASTPPIVHRRHSRNRP